MRDMLREIKEGLKEMGIDVWDFALVRREGFNYLVEADGTAYAIEIDPHTDSAEIVDEYLASMIRREW